MPAGDVGIALESFWGAASSCGGRHWAGKPSASPLAVFLAIGLVSTIVLEFANTAILNRWSYANEMPRLPVLGTGLARILQWLIAPPFAKWPREQDARMV